MSPYSLYLYQLSYQIVLQFFFSVVTFFFPQKAPKGGTSDKY